MTPSARPGDLLRDFYGTYGMPKEGPSSSGNLDVFLSSVSVPETELDILRTALDDDSLRRQFRMCREILDDLATRLTGQELMNELVGVPLPSPDAIQRLSSGVFWFALAASLDERKDGLPVTPVAGPADVQLPIKVQMTVHGSLVLRLYIALVYMREGVLSDMIGESARGGGPCSGRVRKLLNSDYVRRIRNALSHGSFSACIAGLVFRDEHGAIVATPGFLQWLGMWLMLIQLQALASTSSRQPRVV
jgi:hypothetical protein